MRKFFIVTFFFFIFSFLVFFTPLSLFSQEIEYPPVPEMATPTAETTFPQYVKYLFNLAIRIVGLITLAVMVWAGILYLTSGGDVSQKVEAKNKITGALLGAFILLCSYLILWTINPQLLTLSLPPVEPYYGGIYLIDKNNKEHFLADTTAKISVKDIKKIKFVSSADSLSALYIYDKEDFGGNEKRIPNTGGTVSLSPSTPSPKSIYFLWNKPGVYLCSATTSVSDIFASKTICPKRPLYTALSIPDLSQTKPYFDNLAKSLQIVDDYQAVLFSDPGFESKCSFSKENVPDLSASTTLGYNNPSIGNSTTSSIVVSYSQPASGNVNFYDRINCKGEKWSTTTGGTAWRDLSATTTKFSGGTLIYENILSIEIDDGFGVLLNTETDGSGVCQFFKKPEGETNCVSSLVGTAVYQPEPEPATPGNQTKKVRSVYIFYHQE